MDKRYDVERELGRGSYAEIFVAHDILASKTSAHECVVIKALNVFLQDDLDPELERTLVENFQNEAVALDRVRHPNIISRLGHGTARDLKGTVFHYLVLEYLEGGDLSKASRHGNLSFKQSFKYIEQVCAGLRHAHRHNVIHRDIKPQNLLLTKDRETVKIADFGVARVNVSDSPITRVGTNVYAPPEHSPLNFDANGHMTVATLTPAADIYSLAKSVYTLITGESPRAFANQQITELPLTWRDKEWSADLLRVLRKATESDPVSRHQSIDEFWTDLEPVRKIAYDMETFTAVRPKMHETPQAHVAVGYSPVAPTKAKFDSAKLHHPFGPKVMENADRGLRNADSLGNADRGLRNADSVVPKVEIRVNGEVQYPGWQRKERAETELHVAADTIPDTNPEISPDELRNPQSAIRNPKRRFVRRLATFAILLAIFAGGLYGTSAFLRSRGIIPSISNPFATKTGHANTDINLRPDPSSSNDPIGLVTKNSKVKILKSQNNWYQVDVLEQGRDVNSDAKRGWLNGKYVDLD